MNVYFVVFKRKDGYSKRDIWAHAFQEQIKDIGLVFEFKEWFLPDTAIYEEI